MIVLTQLEAFSRRQFPNPVLTLGVFDGVHRGHQKILRFVKKRAETIRGTACVFTFREHPQKVLNPKEKLSILTSTPHKLALLKDMGIDLCIAIDFTREFSRLKPEDFAREILLKRLCVKEVYLGTDARFGHDRRGGVSVMEKLAARYGFRFGIMQPHRVGRITVSSTRIRTLVRQGKLDKAGRLLGRPYSILASVIPGQGRGRTLGFPTANLNPESEVLPPNGVYVVESKLFRDFPRADGKVPRFLVNGLRIERNLQGVLNLGFRPTFDSKVKHAVPEVHFINWNEDLYGRTLEVVFHKFLRPEVRFANPYLLKEKIKEDLLLAQRFFEKTFSLQGPKRRLYYGSKETISC